jgi:RsmE family RNA methyltransferase
MNLILLEEDDFVAGLRHAHLRGRRAHHIVHVLRAQPGRQLRVGLLGGPMGVARVTTADDVQVQLEVALEALPPAPLPVILLLALPRPKSLKKVLQAATCMGVKRLFLMETWRVEKSFWSSPALRPEALREQMLLGLEQAGDTILPEIQVRRRFKPFVEDELGAVVAGTRALVAHPGAADLCPHVGDGFVTLAIGPERGFTDYELAMLGARGFRTVSLGERRLRVEDAVPALLGRLF